MARIEADWLTRAETQRVFAILGEAWAVGGCVRDTLLGKPVKDIDISTPVHPEEVMVRAKAAGLKVVPTGIDHGTVTIVAGEAPYEVTTFRRDVETDGRRAVVAFSGNMEDDARRRDFTINALYADASGVITDPVGGIADLEARRVRFIEDAGQRIREDYLRSLRFFRFCAYYADGFDADALDAIARNLSGLETLSRERVGHEMLRLLAAPDPAPAVAAMRATGVLGVILPGADDRALAPLIHLELTAAVAPDAIRRLAALGGEDVEKRLRLSRKDASRLAALRAADGTAGELGYRLGALDGCNAMLLTAASRGVPIAEGELVELAEGAKRVFPVRSDDLMPRLQGKALGDELKRLEQDWIASGFTLSRDDLLGRGDNRSGID